MDAAILFEADAFRLDGPKLMGRQSAGNGFLRAAVNANSGGELWGFSPYSNSQGGFQQTVAEMDPSVRTRWIGRSDFRTMGERRVLFRPDGEIAMHGELRQWAGAGLYSICGLTHTLSGKPIASFAALPTAPLTPWDAIVCTSTAARSVLEGVFEASEAYLTWRMRGAVKPSRPQLPVIPLGVHARDFDFTEAERATGRADIGLQPDEVAVLFAGRLTFHAKAHPFQMLEGLQEAARRTGARLVLIQAGVAPNESVLKSFQDGIRDFAPDVRAVFVDGKDFGRYRGAWAAADIFISLSDNIQETFGITPVEAMAAGVPVIVSDWDGYRDTVRDGEDGFRIPTRAPAPGHGDHVARDFHTGTVNYDYMIYRSCMSVSVDPGILADRLSALASDAELRRKLGENGRRRAREVYDWAQVYARYRAMWDELDAIRVRDSSDDYWRTMPGPVGYADPYRVFSTFPTDHVTRETRLVAAPGASAERYFQLENHGLFPHWKIGPDVIGPVFTRLAQGEIRVQDIAELCRLSPAIAVEVACRLLKMNLVREV